MCLWVLLERSWWTGFNGIYLVTFGIQNVGEILIFNWFLKIQINSKKPRFWKEKSVEDMVTLGANGTGHTNVSGIVVFSFFGVFFFLSFFIWWWNFASWLSFFFSFVIYQKLSQIYTRKKKEIQFFSKFLLHIPGFIFFFFFLGQNCSTFWGKKKNLWIFLANFDLRF